MDLSGPEVNSKMKPLKVSEVNNYIKRIFSRDFVLTNIDVEGEISNFNHHYSGHMYFTLKDSNSKMRCVMFKDDNTNLTLELEDGMNIVASGYISVYDREGSYQLYVKKIKAYGVGELHQQFEMLKRKLEKEGLFDKKKKLIPSFSKNIGVVTSASGAAIRDIINVIKRRNPSTNIFIYPVAVQGQNAPSEIIEGIEFFDKCDSIDLIITGRGGGSLEELFAFNNEELARTIYKSKTPIISAVGHQTDFTIADFVADCRAPTPSAAAEIAVPNINSLNKDLENKFSLLSNLISKRFMLEKNRLKMFGNYINYANPTTNILNQKQNLDYLLKHLTDTLGNRLTSELSRLKELKTKLDYYNRYFSLDNGLAIVYNKNKQVIKTIKDIGVNDLLNILLKDGVLEVKVSNIFDKGDINDE